MKYPVSEVVGKRLYSSINQSNAVYSLPDLSINPLYVVDPTELIGTVFSYIERSGRMWWQIETANQSTVYVLHQKGFFDIDRLIAQGMRTEEQVKEDQEQAGDTFLTNAGEIINTGIKEIRQIVVIIIAATIIRELL